jgi:hypothetical protein
LITGEIRSNTVVVYNNPHSHRPWLGLLVEKNLD